MPTGAEEDPQPMVDLSHGVLGEEFTATWCSHCPYVADALNNIYESNDYQFYFVAMITDYNDKATQRANDYNIPGYPTSVFDGGYETKVGSSNDDTQQTEDDIRPLIESCGARTVPDLNVEVHAYDLGSSELQISVKVTNNEGEQYGGHLRTYITEIISRYSMYDDNPYHFGFLDYAFDTDITVPAASSWEDEMTWIGSEHHDDPANPDDTQYFGDIVPSNIMVIAAVFNDEVNLGNYDPPYSANVFEAYYVDQTAGVIPTLPLNYGVSLIPPTQQQTVGAGEAAQYAFTVQNTGDADDVIDLTKSGTNSDWGTLSETSISLGPGLSQEVTMQVDVPPGTEDGSYVIDVTATSQGDSSKTITVSTTTIVSSVIVYGVELYADITSQNTFAGEAVIYTITVKNTGNTADDIQLSKTEFTTNWGTLSTSQVSLAGGASEDITLTVDVPADADSGDYLIKVKGTSASDGSKYDEIGTTTVVEELTYGTVLSPDPQDGTVEAGNDVYFTINVMNTGNTQDIIDLMVSGQNAEWGDLSQSAVSLDAGDDSDVTLTISVPETASAGVYDFTVSGESQGDSSAYDDVSVALTVTEPPEEVEPIAFSNIQHTPANPTPDDEITVTATITGDGIEKVTLYVCEEILCFDSVLMTATGSNGYTGTFGPLEEGSYHYHMSVKKTSGQNVDSEDVYFTVTTGSGGDVDTDGDGVNDADDDFPSDPSASEDTDGDGYPDEWNIGKSKEDSTTNLELDAYPNDSTRWAADKEEETPWFEKQNNQYMIMFFVTIVIISLLLVVAMSRKKKGQEQMTAAMAMPVQPVGVQTVAMGAPVAAQPVFSSFEPVQPATEDISCPRCGIVFGIPLSPRPLQVQCPSCLTRGMID